MFLEDESNGSIPLFPLDELPSPRALKGEVLRGSVLSI